MFVGRVTALRGGWCSVWCYYFPEVLSLSLKFLFFLWGQFVVKPMCLPRLSRSFLVFSVVRGRALRGVQRQCVALFFAFSIFSSVLFCKPPTTVREDANSCPGFVCFCLVAVFFFIVCFLQGIFVILCNLCGGRVCPSGCVGAGCAC